MLTAFINARVFTGDAVLENAAVLVEDQRVVATGVGLPLPSGARTVDLNGLSIAPACIDLQVYGGKGKLFNNEPTVEAIESTWQQAREGGASHFQITLSCSPPDTMWRAIDACRDYRAAGGRGLLGLHLEGPFFNPAKRGAHPLEHIRKPDPALVAEIVERGQGVVRYMTLAPEQVDDISLDILLESGICLAAGHSNATFTEASRGFEKGITRATHLFNAMSAFQGREPGLVGAIYAYKPWTSIIADGIHCDYNALKISKEILGDRLFLISDAVTESLAGDYRFRFADDRYVDDVGVLAGSSLDMWQAVQNVVRHAGIDLAEALRMASSYPALVVSEGHRLGRIAPGYEAHFAVFDAAMQLVDTTALSGSLFLG